MVKSKVWKLKTEFSGKVEISDFELTEEEVSDNIKDGEFLTEALYWTVDPYMRTNNVVTVLPGDYMPGEQISKVITSKNSSYPVGSIVRAFSGWRSHTLVTRDAFQMLGRMPDMGDLPLSLALGAMGMPGMTAYFGFLELCKPKKGDIILVNGAAGAVGSLGCEVVGCAGNDIKCKWLKDLGFDKVFNYNKVCLSDTLKTVAPDGFDCFFDNVGGDFTCTALKHMKQCGRVTICGYISLYNDEMPFKGEYPFKTVNTKELQVKGLVATRWYTRWPEGEKVMAQWIKDGAIKYKETIYRGIETMPQAFVGLFDGTNTGKAIISA
ncbi:Prostaglandin reductase 1 [Mizuhopecten yessoensis]|uniref:Prostaglandin reductase 1 n=1 Tax=Mizuhopecten yessoensis TaxID=6573 RepID=A0A210PET6_MIZYE|nr:Prostaglandin reductase 1 [Mizuhopecten yessoensis]